MSFLKLGFVGFGGPAMVVYLEDLVVKRFHWMNKKDVEDGVSLCQSLPGATAMQMAAYAGLKIKGLRGAFCAFAGFGVPPFLLMILLTALYERYSGLEAVMRLFGGLKAIVTAMVIVATARFGRDILNSPWKIIIALMAALALIMGASPFFVILGSSILGALVFGRHTDKEEQTQKRGHAFPVKQTVMFLFFLGLGMWVLFFVKRDWFTLTAVMMKINVFAFGGGFGALPLMYQQVVSVYGWMDAKTFMDGVALGNVTPGPIIITSTFIGYMLYGIAGATLATIAMFTPSFLALVVTAPYYEYLKKSVVFKAAMSGILSSFVGLLLFVAIKFAGDVGWNFTKIAIGTGAVVALWYNVRVHYVVLAGALLSALVV